MNFCYQTNLQVTLINIIENFRILKKLFVISKDLINEINNF